MPSSLASQEKKGTELSTKGKTGLPLKPWWMRITSLVIIIILAVLIVLYMAAMIVGYYRSFSNHSIEYAQ